MVNRRAEPRATAGDGTVTVPNGPSQVSTRQQVLADSASGGPGGHNSMLQQATRLGADVTDVYGKARPQGTPVPVREDFNTLRDDVADFTPRPPAATTVDTIHCGAGPIGRTRRRP